MNPYELDQQTYANAVAQYMRHAKKYDSQVNAYNAAATAYNDSFVKVPDNNNGWLQVGYINGQWTQYAPPPSTGTALWTNPANGQQLLRRVSGYTPTGQTGSMSKDPWGRQYFNSPNGSAEWGIGDPMLTQGYVVPVDTNNLSTTLAPKEWGDAIYDNFNNRQSFALYRPTFVDNPGSAPAAFSEPKPTAPTGTIAQEAGRESAAHQMANSLRGGLVSEVLASRGVR